MSEQQEQYITDALEMMGTGYEKAAIIERPRKTHAIGKAGLEEYQLSGWVKMSAKFCPHIKNLRGAKLAIWLCLALNIDEDGECQLSQKELCAMTGYSHTEVIDSVKELDEMGFLSVDRSNKRNLYSPAFVAKGKGNSPTVKKVDSTPADSNESSPSYKNFAPTSIKKKKEIKKKADKPLIPAEVLIYRSVTSKYPNKAAYDEVIKAIQKVSSRLGRECSADDLLPYFKSWCTKSGNMYNFSVWLMEWAVAGTMQNKPAQKNDGDALDRYIAQMEAAQWQAG